MDDGGTAVANSPAPAEVLGRVTAQDFVLPEHESKIYKDECMHCYRTPYFPGGLYICLKTFACFCEKHMRIVAERTKNVVYLQLISRKMIVESDEPKDKVKRLAIPVEDDKVEVEDEYYLVVYPDVEKRIRIEDTAGSQVGDACRRIATTTSAERLAMLRGASNAWDGEMKMITKFADLEQITPSRSIPSSGWECEVPGCGLKENLWLNLTDGAIRCGRSQLIGEGQRSKGNNHMKLYYEQKNYPLVVKLGTIEKDGSADVHSYAEDASVIDPNLEKHLLFFGLHLADMEKTEKSTIELELDINQKWEWARCQEDGENLENAFGPGFTGMINIGSSCYINSVIQSLLLIPDFVRAYSEGAESILSSVDPVDMAESVIGQCAKLFSSLCSGDFSIPGSDQNGVKPTQFRRVIGRGHHEFQTNKQQDAEEYIRHFLDKIASHQADPGAALRFKLETKLVDQSSGRVRYSEKEEVVLSLPVPKTELIPVDNDALRFSVPLVKCIEAAFSPELIEGFKSPVTGEVKGAQNTIRMATFPDFLVLQVQRFHMDESYSSVKKLDVDVIVDEELDLSAYRGQGIRPGEQLLDDGDLPSDEPRVDEHVVAQIESMGFSHNASVRAVVETGNRGGEQAVEWLMSHMDDPSINDPPRSSAPSSAVESQSVQQLVAFGFTVHQAKYGLAKNPDVNMCAEWLLLHADEVPPEEHKKETRDGRGAYRLCAFVSHMGSSPHSGHYVAHVKKNGRWVLFNDEKVAYSKNPPMQLGYLYFYQRV